MHALSLMEEVCRVACTGYVVVSSLEACTRLRRPSMALLPHYQAVLAACALGVVSDPKEGACVVVSDPKEVAYVEVYGDHDQQENKW